MPDEAETINGAAALPEIRVPAGWTLASLCAGLALGLLGGGKGAVGGGAIGMLVALIEPVGGLWLRALQMTILPLVVALLVVGIVQTVDAARVGAVARRTLGLIFGVYFAGATVAALTMPALLRLFPIPERAVGVLRQGGGPQPPVPGFGDFLQSIVPANVLSAAASDAMLPCVAFFSLFGIAITRLPPAQRRELMLLFEGLAGAMMVIIGWVLALAPLGVFALSLSLAARSGAAAIGVLAHYVALVSSMGGVVLAAAPVLALVLARVSLSAYARAMLPVGAVALSTQSSLASLPAMLGAARRLGVSQANADFVLPLSVAVFRATGPAMNLAVAIYVAKLSGIALSPAALVAGVVVASLTEVGSPSLPGAISFVSAIGPVAIAMGVPVAPLALLVAVEMLPDLMRTIGNVAMDVAVTCAIDRRAGRGMQAR